jgi:hypothetical protein
MKMMDISTEHVNWIVYIVKKRKIDVDDDSKIETFESLTVSHKELLKQIEDVKSQIAPPEEALEDAEEDDELEMYMKSVNQKVNLEKQGFLKNRLDELQLELGRIEKILEIARPSEASQVNSLIVKPRTKNAEISSDRQNNHHDKTKTPKEISSPHSKSKSTISIKPINYSPSVPIGPSRELMEKHLFVERGDGIINSIPKEEERSEQEIKNMNAAYGY